MPARYIGQRSVLESRNSVSHTIQAVLDGLAVVGIAYGLIDYHIGLLTQEYVILILVLMGALAVSYDRYAIYRSYASVGASIVRLWKGWTLAFAFVFLLAFLAKQSEIYSRLLVLELYVGGYLAQLALHLGMRQLQQTMLRHSHEPDNVIFVGSGLLAEFLAQKIAGNPWLRQRVVGCVTIGDGPDRENAPDRENDPVGAAAPILPVLGKVGDLNRLIDQWRVHSVYVVTALDATVVLKDLYFSLLDQHVAVHWVPDIFALRLINPSVREIAGIPIMTLSETPLTGGRLLAKNLEDGLLSILIFILIAPVMVLIAIAIKLDNPGPVFFRQKRMGWNGKIFRIWKFRSMVEHQAEDGVIVQASKNDPRVTRVGAFIRRTSLDELPQIFNVLKGEMSLVGPRPHAIEHDKQYSQRITEYFARHNIKPGITGLAQVRGLRGETRNLEQMIQRVQADIEYINNWSVWLDLVILVRTSAALTGKYVY